MQQRQLTFEKSTRERFEAFHRENPHVYQQIVRYARELQAAGRQRAGIRLIWERLRWDYAMQTSSTNFKLNDHFPPYYARLIMTREADLAGFFETRGRS